MTAELNESEMDRLVSQTYRELGTEEVPEHLNQTILRQAAAAGGRSGARHFSFAAWTKPVAWAATIGLSLAIVLELTQIPAVPVQNAAPIRQEAPTEETVAPSSVAAHESKLKPLAPAPAAAANRSFSKMQAAEPTATERTESKVSADASACDVATQESADDWMECIQDLRETGAIELAAREYEAYLLKYPDR
ncbi:MAG: hypothetical protein MUO51_02650 [Woeseiaceae bacterium]|nr:hypothetical protein [Woeseiaceae bacterium]